MVRISAHRIPTKRRRIGALLLHYAIRIPHLVWRALTLGFLRRKSFPEKIRNLLVIRADGLGDVVMTLPTIAALRDLYPEAEITLLVGSSCRDLVPHLEDIDNALFLDLPWAQRSVRRLDWRQLWRVLGEIRRKNYDLILDLRGDFRNILLMQFMGRGYKIGFGWSGCGFLLDREIPAGEDRHEVDHKLDCAVALGADVRHPRFGLAVRPEDWGAVAGRFPGLGAREEKFVVLHPGAQWPGRQWTASGFAAIADRIVRDLGFSVVITGIAREKQFCGKVLDRAKEETIDLVDRITFGEFLALLSRARLFVGVDSGPMHMAVALGVPVVALFGPGDPAAIGPYGPNHVVVTEGEKFACSPCAQGTCPLAGRSCMDAVSPELVWEAVSRQLGERVDGQRESPARIDPPDARKPK